MVPAHLDLADFKQGRRLWASQILDRSFYFSSLRDLDLSFRTGSDLPKAIILQPVQTQNDGPAGCKIVSTNAKSQRRARAVKLSCAVACRDTGNGVRPNHDSATALFRAALVLD